MPLQSLLESNIAEQFGIKKVSQFPIKIKFSSRTGLNQAHNQSIISIMTRYESGSTSILVQPTS